MGINFHCSQVTLRHEGLPLFLRTSSRLIEWKRTNCKMITRNKISAKAGIQENTGFPRIKYGAGLVKPGMTIKEYKFFGCANIYDALYNNGNPISSLCLRYPSAHNLAKVLTLNMYPTLSVTLIAPRASRRLKV